MVSLHVKLAQSNEKIRNNCMGWKKFKRLESSPLPRIFRIKTTNPTCVNSVKQLLVYLSLISGWLICPIQAQEVPFSKGVNLTQWFQEPSARQIQFSKFTREDIEEIQSLGCDVIRLPINLHFMTDGAPDYIIDPLFYSFLDQVVDWTEELGIHLILDNHTFDPAVSTDPNIGEVLVKVWSQMAKHYKDRSDLIYYEVLNEPHGIDDALWGTIQGEVIEAIRNEDTRHTIVVGGADWNSYRTLERLPRYEDDNLIYTFHFYDPFLFTHQGATWTSPSMLSLADVPFPYEEERMPALPADLLGTWVGFNYLSYPSEGTVTRVQSLLDIAARFRDERQVPVFCGEMGVFKPNSQEDDRVLWYEEVRSYLDEIDITWTMWDYQGGFGVFEKGSNELFDHDLNLSLLEALGWETPPQTEFKQIPEGTGFPIYQDFIEQDVFESSYLSGQLDYYSQDLPNYGEFCIRWSDAERFGIIGLDMIPNKDLSVLVEENYALDLMIRGDQPGTSIDIRFLDSQIAGTDDLPWRMIYTIDEGNVVWDGRWHHLHIPLKDFNEGGAWDGVYYDPIDAFDWAAIDRMEFVAEHHPLDEISIWIDQIHITNRDTAQVLETRVFSDTPTSLQDVVKRQVQIYPNPVQDVLQVYSQISQPLTVELTDLLGKVYQHQMLSSHTPFHVGALAPGMYLVVIKHKDQVLRLEKIIKQ